MSPFRNAAQVFIASAARTPVGSFRGSLAKVTAPALGSVAARAAVERAGLSPSDVEEVFMGNVLSAGLGQAPARQVALGAGCPDTTEATTVNKVCASGMKAITLATQSLQLGVREVMLAGGMESMSNVPFYAPRGAIYGHQSLKDGIIHDGLWDVYNQVAMGVCAEDTAAKYGITREQQDAHAIASYQRAAAAWKAGKFQEEIVGVPIKGRGGKMSMVEGDEEYTKVFLEKIPSLKPVFLPEGGTVTAANASTLSDGASAVVLASGKAAQDHKLTPLAQIISYADAAGAPINFPTAPADAIRNALANAGLSKDKIDLWEINEAFSVVIRANEQLLELDPTKVNVSGGGVALGHPIGSSGARIVVTLTHLLKPGQYGCAAVCNGGGAATAVIIKRL
ncbi:Thiolase, N-terminal domain-containing protein [Piptocephalis cylindrospora]|uniref:acetyl-CoA C-acetyltransferase n=1 Tax=Piptocephalis cylindrospora TaxID=1907219 RepID=A0A4P9Y772_9FUNG|nr:Thiolase, N-terminal domain-containing protein [Piptocephalis cylindrospora]|eukprot:RKP14853.1 Thiolase, N-terminal domain-containing protein [Piptocephalis cylindrospora]